MVVQLLLLLVVAQATQDPPSPEEFVRSTLKKQFGIATADQCSAYQARIVMAFNSLPPDPALRKLAIEQVNAWTISMPLFLKSMDGYRKSADANPELRPLVLPDEYYISSYDLAVRTIERQFDRASKHWPQRPEDAMELTGQASRFRSDAMALLEKELGRDGFEIASAKAAEILDALVGIATHPFYGFDRPLTQEEYSSVMTQIRNNLRELPPIALEPVKKTDGEDFDSLFGTPEREQGETGTAAITDRGRAERVISKVVNSLYLYSRMAAPQSFQRTDQLHKLEDRARAWIADAKQRHGHIANDLVLVDGNLGEWMAKNRAAESRFARSDPPENGTPGTNVAGSTKIQPVQSPLIGGDKPRAVATSPSMDSDSHRLLALLIIALVLLTGVFTAYRVFRMRRPAKG